MNLHNESDAFETLIGLTSEKYRLPGEAIRKDYYIVLILKRLFESRYLDSVVFKGGTSLSKCYPRSIERFSEDIDLTYIPEEGMSQKQLDKTLKKIEQTLTDGFDFEKIPEERSASNKSAHVWFAHKKDSQSRIKLEIGSSVRPHPFEKKKLTTYIQDYLESAGMEGSARFYNLHSIAINALDIRRTFIDKVMAVKRHALSGTLIQKVRHIYDVVKLFRMEEIKKFMNDEKNLKDIVQLTKKTDSIYLEKRKNNPDYDPMKPYAFDCWKSYFDKPVKTKYETLHKTLLYTDNKQDWNEVFRVFESINETLNQIDE